MSKSHFHPDPLKRKIPQALLDDEVFTIQQSILDGILTAAEELATKKSPSYLKGEEIKRNMRFQVEKNLDALDNTFSTTKVLLEEAHTEKSGSYLTAFPELLSVYQQWRKEVYHLYKKVNEIPMPTSDTSRKILKNVQKQTHELKGFVDSAKEKYMQRKKQTHAERKDNDSV